MPCSVGTNTDSETVETLTVGQTFTSFVRWNNTASNISYEVTSTTGQRGFIYSGDVTVSNSVSTLSVTGHEAGTPSGTLAPGSNFGLRGIISSNYTITQVEAHIFNSDGSNAVTPFYSTSWDKTSYNIQTDGINNHFSFRNLESGKKYRYVVAAADSSAQVMNILIDS